MTGQTCEAFKPEQQDSKWGALPIRSIVIPQRTVPVIHQAGRERKTWPEGLGSAGTVHEAVRGQPTVGMEQNGISRGWPCPRWAGFGWELRSFVGCLEGEETGNVDPILHSCIPRVKESICPSRNSWDRHCYSI